MAIVKHKAVSMTHRHLQPDYTFAYQPLVSLLNHKPVACELLLRHFDGVSIDTYLKTPELFNEHVVGLMKAKADVTKHLFLHHDVSSIFINLTPNQISASGFMFSLDAFYKNGISPSSVAIEVTEQFYAGDESAFYTNLKEARRRGHPIVVDDFGSGFSTFNYVRMLKPSIVKTDKSILESAMSDDYSREFLRNLVSFLRTVKCKVVIEGVENTDYLNIAQQCRADYLQGFLFGTPQDIERNVVESSRHFVDLREGNLNSVTGRLHNASY
jgi:EAL domain-containing protein (putative c-di-GMP-specific phosphodiesterase class I)